MIDKFCGALLLGAAILCFAYISAEIITAKINASSIERVERMHISERKDRLSSWTCYMDEKIRADKQESRANDLERKLKRAKDIMKKAKLKYDD